MPKTQELSIEKRAKIVAEFNNGISAEELAGKYICHPYTIWYQLKKERACGSVQNIGQRGQKRRTAEKDDVYIARTIKIYPTISQNKLRKHLYETKSMQISQSAVCRRLKESAIEAYTCEKKHYISKKNKTSRKKFAQKFIGQDTDYWNHVSFTDESIFSLDGT